MQMAAYRPSLIHPSPPAQDPVRASVAHLLSRAYGIPCSAAAQAFVQLVQSPTRFCVALDVLLPLLLGRFESPQRILSAYILYFLYAAYPVSINPFRSAFVEVFLAEHENARIETERGCVSENEQLVWALWKILKGDGSDLGPYSPSTLSRSPLPPKLRAAQLTIDDALAREDNDYDDLPQSTSNAANVISPTLPASRASIENGAMKMSPMSHGDNSKSEVMDQVTRLLLAACQRTLILSEQRMISLSLQHFKPHMFLHVHQVAPLLANNPALGHSFIVSLLKTLPDNAANGITYGKQDVLDVLRRLPPTLPSFDVIGRLLRDPTRLARGNEFPEGATDAGDLQKSTNYRITTIADVMRMDILGRFVHNAISWVENAEREATEGLISDDRAVTAIQNLCRFYNSLIKLGLVDPSSDLESAEMAHFALAYSRYEEANALYRVLVMGKF